MKSLRSNSAPLAFVALILLSLHPVEQVERALDALFLPTRWIAELAAPLRWIESGRFEREDAALADRRAVEGRAGADLALDLRRAAEPTEPALRLGRRLVPGLVLGRVSHKRDSVWLQLDPRIGTVGIPLGAPVVMGEAFVGRVAELDPGESRCRVDLVTGRDFFVGAVHEDDPGLRMTLGGLHETEGPARLAVHAPSERRFRPGRVRVLEPELLSRAVSHLADGYLLGRLHEQTEGAWSVEPVVDFKSGLFQLAILVPKDAERPPELDPVTTLADGGWRPTGPLSAGDGLHGRRTLWIKGGSLAGVRPGAALVATTRLVGRVDPGHPVPPLSARVRLLGDAGLELHVMARLDRDGSARVLGRFVGLGMGPSGAPLFEWESPLGLQLDGAESVAATLYSGSGLEGLPDGLYIGRAELPCAAGRHTVELGAFADGLAHRALWVRTKPALGEQP